MKITPENLFEEFLRPLSRHARTRLRERHDDLVVLARQVIVRLSLDDTDLSAHEHEAVMPFAVIELARLIMRGGLPPMGEPPDGSTSKAKSVLLH